MYFEVYCNKCGKGLCDRSHVNGTSVRVDPCPNCSTEEKKQNTLLALIEGLYKKLSLEYEYYPTIPEIKRLKEMGVKI